MKKILVVGGEGFIGSRLVSQLQKLGYVIFTYDKKSGGNIFDKNKLEVGFKYMHYDIVIHLAAELSNKLIPNIKNNVIGTRNVVKLCKQYNVKKIIFSSSAAVYGNAKNRPTKESDELRPINIYGCAKKWCEKYIRKSGVNYTILRFSNVYGKGGKGIISKLLESENIDIYGGHQTRDFIHVNDVCEGIIKAIEYPYNNTFNISTGVETPIENLFGMFVQKPNSAITTYIRRKRGDITYSCLDNTKAIVMLKWEPKIKLSEGIKNYDKL